jgi:hypothetical protein
VEFEFTHLLAPLPAPAPPATTEPARDAEPPLSLPALLASLIAGEPATTPNGPVTPLAPVSRFAEPRLSDDLLPARRRR